MIAVAVVLMGARVVAETIGGGPSVAVTGAAGQSSSIGVLVGVASTAGESSSSGVLIGVPGAPELVIGLVSKGRVTFMALGLALVELALGVATIKDASAVLEVGHAHGRESRCAVVLGSCVVGLVDGHCSMGDVRLNDLAMDDWLDILVHVVVDALAADGRLNT